MSRNPIDIAFGYTAGFKNFQAPGYTDGIVAGTDSVVGPGLSTVATVATGEENRLHLLDTPGTLSVTRAADTGRVAVYYLDSDWFERIQVFDLAAGATVTTVVGGATITARRVTGMDYLDGGNAGAIDAKISGELVSRIGAGDGFSRIAHYTTPKGQRTVLHGFGLAAQASKPVIVTIWYKQPGKAPKVLNRWPARESLEIYNLGIPRLIQGANFDAWPSVTPVMEGIDIYATAERPAGAVGTTDVAVYMGFLAQITGGDPDAPGFAVY